MSIKIAFAGVNHRTNSFCVEPTSLADFIQHGLCSGEQLLRYRGTDTIAGDAIAWCDSRTDVDLVPLVYAPAASGGAVTRDAFSFIVGEIDVHLRDDRVDAVVLDLGGTLVIDDLAGGDGALVTNVRSVVGPDVPIIITLGPSANLDSTLLANADLILPYHVDSRGGESSPIREALSLASRCISGEITPVVQAVKLSLSLPQIAHTQGNEVIDALQTAVRQHRENADVLGCGVLWGFPYSDVPHTGMGVVVTTDGNAELAEQICTELGELILSGYRELWPDVLSVEEAVHAAMDARQGPTVLVDCGDDPNQGASGDGTALLWALLDLGAEGAVLGSICDQDVVAIAFSAGIGAEIEIELGGKRDNLHGAPVPVSATVRELADDRQFSDGMIIDGGKGRPGRTAVLSCRGRHGNLVEVIVSERRLAVTNPDAFLSQGIQPTDRAILVIKSGEAARFLKIASRLIIVNTPGLSQLDFAALPFEHLDRPVWPHDTNEPRMIKMY